MSVIINGYRTKENIGNATFETLNKKIRIAISEKQRAEYVRLLNEEINLVADYYVLNYITINKGKSILDVAQEKVCQRIDEASRSGAENRYNFHIALEIMSYKKRWYFLVVSNNDSLTEGILDSVADLEKFITTDDEDNHTEENQKIWNEIREKYTNELQPMRQHYMVSLPMMVNPGDLHFKTVRERALYQAENKEYNIIFQSLTGGKAIPPMELMRYMNEIVIEAENPRHAVNIQRNISQLLAMLPNLTEELVTKPSDALFKNPPDAQGETGKNDDSTTHDDQVVEGVNGDGE